MKKEFRFCFLSHLSDQNRPVVRFVFVIGLLLAMPLLATAGPGDNSGGSNPATAVQQQRVTGTITDASSGEPLVGVNIVVDGTTTGTMTDINGKYTIEVPSRNSVLALSYIGYVAQKVNVEGRAVIDIPLESDILALEEIVVTGYGSQRRSDLTGSVSSVKTEEILRLPTQRVD